MGREQERALAEKYGTPFIFLARPGAYGSGGDTRRMEHTELATLTSACIGPDTPSNRAPAPRVSTLTATVRRYVGKTIGARRVVLSPETSGHITGARNTRVSEQTQKLAWPGESE